MKIYCANSRGTGIDRFIGKDAWIYINNMLYEDFYVRVLSVDDSGTYAINKVPARLVDNPDAAIDDNLIGLMGYSMGMYHTFTLDDSDQEIRDFIKKFILSHKFLYNGLLRPAAPLSVISTQELVDRIDALSVVRISGGVGHF